MPMRKWLTNISKRQQFAVVTIVATLGLVATQLVTSVEYYLSLALGLSLLVGSISIFALWRDARGFRRYSSVILLVYYTAAVSFFYFLLPARWLTRLPAALLFGVGFYAVLLVENIYNVATGRSIQLLRAARSIGLLMVLVTTYLFFETIISFHLNAVYNGLLFFIVSFPLAFHSLWSMDLDLKLDHKLVYNSLLLALIVAEVGLALSFWPGVSTLHALFLSALFYTIVGIYQQKIIDRLFPKTVREFVFISVIVFAFVFFTTSWVG
jgi:hypothetical protein